MAKGDNRSLHAANRAKKDEFYTQLSDIEKELGHYTEHFKGKVVYCNCDDPYESNFFKYFILNFNRLELKKLITTCYAGSPVAGTKLNLDFSEGTRGISHKIEISAVNESDGFTLDDVEQFLKGKSTKKKVKKLKENGDFRSEECVELLKEADIVVTNPPFSLFREYIAQLMKYRKKFLIIGNQNAITYKEIFPLLKENKMWLGFHSGHTLFAVPESYEIPEFYDKEDRKKLRSNGYIVDDTGRLWRNLGNICWFTNLDHKKRHEELVFYETYSPEKYPHYDNYDAINVDKVAEAPKDYNGVMGVPITFLEKYNPDQFEILALGNSRENFTPTKDYINPVIHLKNGNTANGGKINLVLTLATKKKPQGVVYYTSDNSDYLVPPYARILIRKR